MTISKTCSNKEVLLTMFSNFYKFFILTLSSELLFTNLKVVSNASKGCEDESTIPDDSLKPVSDSTNNYLVSQKLRSTECQLISLKRHINALSIKLAYMYNLRGHTKCRCETSTAVNLQSEESIKHVHIDITNPENIEDRTLSRVMNQIIKQLSRSNKITGKIYMKQLARRVRTILRRELSTFKQDLAWLIVHKYEFPRTNILVQRKHDFERRNINTDVMKHHIVPKTRSMDHPKAYVQADSVSYHDASAIRSLYKRSGSNYANNDAVKIRKYMTSKFEQIDHDMETLANGISVLHDNMFEYKDIKKQFSQEKTRMESNILQKLRSEYNDLNMKVEYTNNQLQTVSDLLQATVKSQKNLQSKIQNFNATFKLKIYKTDMNILNIMSRLDALNETLNKNYNENVSDATQVKDMEDTIAFVSKVKDIWPTLVKNVTAVRTKENELLNILNKTLEKYDRKVDVDTRHSLRQNCNSGARFMYFRLYYLEIVNVIISLYVAWF